MSEQAPQTLAPSRLLQLLSEELLHCRAILAQIEHLFHHRLEDDALVDRLEPWQVGLQDIDLLEQNLGDLATCLSGIAADPQLQAAGDLSVARILGPLKLDDLRRRLIGRPEHRTGAQKIELF